MAKRRAKPPSSASDQAERLLVKSALAKIERGQAPSSQERAALKRGERAQEEERRWQYVQNTPKGMYCEMAGRPWGVVIKQAKLYGLPYPSQKTAKVDLAEVIHFLHDLMAEGRILNAPQTDDPLLAGSNSPALERYRLARAAREELELAARRGELLDVDELLTWYDAKVAAPIRRSLEALQSQFGPAAVQVVAKALGQAGAAVGKRLKGEGVTGR